MSPLQPHLLSPMLQLFKGSGSSAPMRSRTHSSSPCSSWEINSGLGTGSPVEVRALVSWNRALPTWSWRPGEK